jgi:hypothetical protein
MHLSFRLASTADLPSVLSLLAGEHSGLTKAALDRILSRIQRYPDYHIWVSENDAIIIATFTLVCIDGITHGGASVALLTQFAVRTGTHAGEAGIASLLFAKDLARQRGCHQLVLVGDIDPAIASHCAALGFAPGPLTIDPEVQVAMSGR